MIRKKGWSFVSNERLAFALEGVTTEFKGSLTSRHIDGWRFFSSLVRTMRRLQVLIATLDLIRALVRGHDKDEENLNATSKKLSLCSNASFLGQLYIQPLLQMVPKRAIPTGGCWCYQPPPTVPNKSDL